MDLFNYQNQNIKNHFQRSIRIDNELSKEFLDHFIFHATGKKVLNQITSSINNSNQCAFTLTGPYGTGKSSLALFLQALLSNNNKIRNLVKKFQLNIAYNPPSKFAGSVLDGRDITSVIMKDAMFKFFITADLKTRAKRRYLEYKKLKSKSIYENTIKKS